VVKWVGGSISSREKVFSISFGSVKSGIYRQYY